MEYSKGEGVVIKEPMHKDSHVLKVGSKGVVVGYFGLEHPTYYDVAGISVLHPDRVIVNTLHVDEFETF